jgi:hypothetical protein
MPNVFLHFVNVLSSSGAVRDVDGRLSEELVIGGSNGMQVAHRSKRASDPASRTRPRSLPVLLCGNVRCKI